MAMMIQNPLEGEEDHHFAIMQARFPIPNKWIVIKRIHGLMWRGITWEQPARKNLKLWGSLGTRRYYASKKKITRHVVSDI